MADPASLHPAGAPVQATCSSEDLALLRRYGTAPSHSGGQTPFRTVFLERKSKWGDRVAKRRVVVSEADLPHLARAAATEGAGTLNLRYSSLN